MSRVWLNWTCTAAVLVGSSAYGTISSAEGLPKRVQGVWALDLSDCHRETDFKVEVTAVEVSFAASLWSAQNWTLSAAGWRAWARVEEGGTGLLKGRHAIVLQLTRDGSLLIRRRGQPDTVYHRCL